MTACLTLFGLATLGMAAATGVGALAALRIVAGVGIGGAIPNAAALIAEYTPARRRAFAVAASIVCVPLGGVVGGAIAAAVLPGGGWRTLFALAGALPIAMAGVIAVGVPESSRYLLAKLGDGRRVRRALARAGVAVERHVVLVDGSAIPGGRSGQLHRLVEPGWRRDSIALWCAFACCLVATYAGFGWLPTMLADAGFDLSLASSGLTAFNTGGVAAALGGAWLMASAGSRLPMIATAVAGAVLAIILSLVPLRVDAPTTMIVALTLLGACTNGVQTMLYALAAGIYPLDVRAGGVGAAAGMGRIGALASSFLGSIMLSLFAQRGFFLLVAAALSAAALSLAAMRRHLAAMA